MTREETIKVLTIIKAAYPSSYRNMTKEEANGTVTVWTSQFAKTPATVVMMAVNKLIATSVFPPSICEVKNKISGIYWEATEMIMLHNNGSATLDDDKLRSVMLIADYCDEHIVKKEPTIYELLPAYQRYLTDGSE